jgi:hypothetical protein
MLDRTLFLGLAVIAVIAVSFFFFHHPRVSKIFHRHIPDRSNRRLTLAAISFFPTFAIARGLAYSNYHHIGPFHDIYIRGRHVHHLVWGIFILLAVGYAWLIEIGSGDNASSVISGRLVALLYGAGAALTLDEFALWLNLEDVYWARQGRASLDAVVIFGVLLIIGILGGRFFVAVVKEFTGLMFKR